jgi:2,4-dienoyl-CoA reductase-like NADH-dependent reductase (Old Yellow Enzyme family)
MHEAEIEEIIAGFVAAAARAQKAGFDGIELFGAYNGLIEQFWLPWSNRRNDQWGGSIDNRMRFTRRIIEDTRRQVGEDFIIGLSASVDSGVEVALKIEGFCEVVQWLDSRALIDYISCGTGGYFNFAELMPTFQFADKLGAPLAEALKQVVSHARVMAESHIRTPENANYVIASGQSDLVSIVRGQIADPHLANKVRSDHADQVRGCISCNQMCWGRRSRDYRISCQPVGRTRVRMGRRPVHACADVSPRAGRRWRASRHGVRTRGRRAGSPRHAGRGRTPTGRRFPAGRATTAPHADSGTDRLV